jgi:hypothetical protein
MVQALRAQRIGQGLHDVLLPDHLSEVLGTVFASEHEIGHRRILGGPNVPFFEAVRVR